MTQQILLALTPIALLIALGHVLRRRRFVPDHFWPSAERLGYYVLVPSLFLDGLATARLDGIPVAGLVTVLVVSTLCVAAMLMVARPWMGVGGAAFTSIFQGGVRFNNYVGVTAAVGLFGAQGLALAAVSNAAIVPTVNVLCVLVFARFGAGGRFTPGAVLRQVAMNPLVLGCAGGIALQATGTPLPRAIEPVFKALGQASLPMGLLCVGAALDWGTARTWVRPIIAASAAKFLAMPAVAALVIALLDLHGPAAVTAVLFQALPTASSSYIMARQLGGDAPLMAGITAMQTIIAAAAIPLAMVILAG